MYAKTKTGVLYGLLAETAIVETDLASGLPCFSVVGLADQSVREAKERIRAAIVNEGYAFPSRRITVNLSPAGRKKEGTHFDLPIAVSVLAASQRIPKETLPDYAFIGELSLDGVVNRVEGVLALLIGLQQSGVKKVFLPEKNMEEGMLLSGLMLYPVSRLGQVGAHLGGKRQIQPVRANSSRVFASAKAPSDFSDVKGQERVKRAVVVAGAASHGLLLSGPPGVGKTMIGRRIPGVLPKLSYEEQLEVTRIYSVAGMLTGEQPVITERPFRAPHHSLSAAAFAGGGSRPKPGEITLAHRGVLFLDELPEFRRRVLEMLRTPLEDGSVTISRLSGNYTFPAEFMLVAAMNPCLCGYYGDDSHECTCTETQVQAYLSKLSGPLLDRIDIHVEMMPVSYGALMEEGKQEKRAEMGTEEMRAQIVRARRLQQQRYTSENILYNSQLTPSLMHKYCCLSKSCKRLLEQAYHHYGLSARAKDKALKLSRTIADISGSAQIGEEHLAEALQYRCLDKISRKGKEKKFDGGKKEPYG